MATLDIHISLQLAMELLACPMVVVQRDIVSGNVIDFLMGAALPA